MFDQTSLYNPTIVGPDLNWNTALRGMVLLLASG